MSERPLPLTKHAVALVTHAMLRLVYGGSLLAVHQEMLGVMGWRRFWSYIRQNIATVRLMSKRYGEVDTQFLIGLAAMWNGCGTCSYGHVLTGALLVYRDQGTLHPLDPHVIAELLDMRNDQAVHALTRRLEDHPRLREFTVRMHELRTGKAQPTTVDDHMLEAILRLWTEYVECSIVVGMTMTPDEAFCPSHSIGRDKQLLARYRRARRAERSASPAGQQSPP